MRKKRESWLDKEIGVLRGWKEIRDACGLKCSTQTMRRMAREYHIPNYYMDNRPTVHNWMVRQRGVIFTQKLLEIEARRGLIAVDSL